VAGSEEQHPGEERELKFTPGPSFQMPDLGDGHSGITVAPAETLRLQAAYFDTPDLRLARSGASLRFRNDEGWTVKHKVSDDLALVRTEMHLGGEPGDPPEAAVDMVHALIRREPLVLAARLNTVRHRFVVLDRDGAQVAELVDDEVSVLDGARLAARFRELEVEFTELAGPDLVESIADQLRDAGAGEPEQIPKIVRALGPRALDPPDLVPPPKLDFASTPLEVLRAAVATSTARLLAHDPVVRVGSDAEGVHQARVATRRIRSDLRTFGTVVDPEWDAALRAELQWLAQLLGTVRDTDVLLERLEGRLQELPSADLDAGKQLLEGLRDHRTRARDELLGAMRSERYHALLDHLVAASRHIPPSHDGAALDLELGDLVKKPWKKLRAAVDRLGDEPADEALHAVRIKAKRCRYAAEAVASAVGKEAKRFARAVEGFQEVLGDHQDAVVAGQWLRTHAMLEAAGRVETAFVGGELAALEDIEAAESRAQWPDAWAEARRGRLRRWM
jgi:CHAD domain-containing protein